MKELSDDIKYHNLKNDVMILTIYLKRYFYSVDVNNIAFDKMQILISLPKKTTGLLTSMNCI